MGKPFRRRQMCRTDDWVEDSRPKRARRCGRLLLVDGSAISCYKLSRDLSEQACRSLDDSRRHHEDPRRLIPVRLMYSKIFLRLEPLGIELIAAAARRAGHEVRLIDLQVEPACRITTDCSGEWRPDAIAFSCNYLANVPEVIDLAKAAAIAPARGVRLRRRPQRVVHRPRAARARARARSTACSRAKARRRSAPLLEAAAARDRAGLLEVPGVGHARRARGRRPASSRASTTCVAARDLLRHRRKYFIGVLDPCASIEFSRGCPWDCSFCSAWTFYGRSYRVKSAEAAADELARIREPGVFIVDDVAFIQAEHGMAIGEAIARRGIKKQYYLETRGDVLLRNKEVFRFWKTLGLQYMFLGVEAIDEEGLKRFRKRVTLSKNFEALEFARSLGIMVAINIIADPDWDRRQFEVIREWCLEIPEIVNISVNTPYPGTESWLTESRRLDHARLPALRHPARRAADAAAARRVLRGAGQHAAGAQPQAPGLVGRQVAGGNPGRQPGARPDQHAQDALEVQQRLQSGAPARRPRAPGPVRDVASARASRGR